MKDLGTQAIRYAKNVHMRWEIEHQFACCLLLQIAKKFDLTKAEVLHLILLINSSPYLKTVIGLLNKVIAMITTLVVEQDTELLNTSTKEWGNDKGVTVVTPQIFGVKGVSKVVGKAGFVHVRDGPGSIHGRC